jgi:hypothetical protein
MTAVATQLISKILIFFFKMPKCSHPSSKLLHHCPVLLPLSCLIVHHTTQSVTLWPEVCSLCFAFQNSWSSRQYLKHFQFNYISVTVIAYFALRAMSPINFVRDFDRERFLVFSSLLADLYKAFLSW